MVETRPDLRASASMASTRAVSRVRLGAAEPTERLLADPTGKICGGADASDTFERLAELDPNLDGAESILLSDAVDHQRDVLILVGARPVAGRSGRSSRVSCTAVGSWRYLREAQWEFTSANIESVAPVG
ncbi:hypothetical protein LWC34_37955 [Kibdelosporangium philippinense]|uniref:SnoaL-like domain-containing protein n=2 Tax=Kibdelosporangium philippinense TaxID=211113 RepID=A0ABS8ZM20_9PSEU|nr:hypothetical protein [Kibdelosporangium philippinense]MCE7008557.1 hypothetical protein [Kibdelosporangium philippinense]